MLAYLSRYTHRVAISNSRLIGITNTSVTFKWKDYRANGRDRAKVMTLAIDEFIRRFLTHAHLSLDGEASFAPRIAVAFAVAADRRALRKTRTGSTIMKQ